MPFMVNVVVVVVDVVVVVVVVLKIVIMTINEVVILAMVVNNGRHCGDETSAVMVVVMMLQTYVVSRVSLGAVLRSQRTFRSALETEAGHMLRRRFLQFHMQLLLL